MSHSRDLVRTFVASVVLLLAAAHVCPAQQPTSTPSFKPYRASGIYNVGEKVGWTAELPPGAPRTAAYTYAVRKNNQEVVKTGTLDFSTGRASIETTLDEPSMVYVQVTAQGGGGQGEGASLALGAAVAPERLQPSAPRPADFDAFWESKIRALKSVPENAVLTPSDGGRANVDYAVIRMDNVGGGHVYGQLAKPKRAGKFPALVILQWAGGPYPLQKQWVTDRAAEGWLAINIEPHDVLPTEPQAYYDALPQELKSYQAIGREDREKSYFLKMYLADYRAVEYVSHRPDWDGRTLVVMGTSMGGQQALAVAGLHPKVTHVVVNEPAGCDTNGPLHGRASGYPNWPADNPQALKTALYFDPVNFAPRIRVPSLVAMGFVDTVTPPVGIWIAFNQIKGPKEAAPMIESPHNHQATPAQQRPFTVRSGEWLNTIVHGGQVRPNPDPTRPAPADQPTPRSDQNSMIAHAELLEKRKKGRIDVYFLGDSITRRWGTSDEQYKTFLENWRQNFYGWNAADFGWGGDTTQNILWRLENGELDGVNPKVIVLMAGTNNVGRVSPQGDEEARTADVTRGIKAVLDLCRRKAPKAAIILMGITPRNDNVAVMPVINRINDSISKFADGKRVRYVNINDRLADREGRLYEGMTNRDLLHLDVKGYQVWADALKPILKELLGPPAKEDKAPPPTGDPSARK
ncbi:MAG: acetylxylan esterase [Acidobacteria bacterium]|nr:acetylxylan esterase [Acidobacteriota bacterium]